MSELSQIIDISDDEDEGWIDRDPARAPVIRRMKGFYFNHDDAIFETGGKDFSQFFLSEELSDIKIKCEEETYNCHKIILASSSPVFKAMLNYDMVEVTSGCINIENFKPKVVKFALEFIYKSYINVMEVRENATFASDLLAIAEQYQLDELKRMCEIELCSYGLGFDNALNLLVLGDRFRAPELKECALELIVNMRREVFENWGTKLVKFVKAYPELSAMIMKLL